MNSNSTGYKFMPIIYNNWLPLPGYAAMMWWGRIYARKKYKPLSVSLIQHEEIHRLQAEECVTERERARGRFTMACPHRRTGGDGMIYLRYWLKYGYRMIPFEQEARRYCGTPGILQTGRRWHTLITCKML